MRIVYWVNFSYLGRFLSAFRQLVGFLAGPDANKVRRHFRVCCLPHPELPASEVGLPPRHIAVRSQLRCCYFLALFGSSRT